MHQNHLAVRDPTVDPRDYVLYRATGRALGNYHMFVFQEKFPRQFVVPQGVRQELGEIDVFTIFDLFDQLSWYRRATRANVESRASRSRIARDGGREGRWREKEVTGAR